MHATIVITNTPPVQVQETDLIIHTWFLLNLKLPLKLNLTEPVLHCWLHIQETHKESAACHLLLKFKSRLMQQLEMLREIQY